MHAPRSLRRRPPDSLSEAPAKARALPAFPGECPRSVRLPFVSVVVACFTLARDAEPLERYLKQQAGQDVRKDLSLTYVLAPAEKLTVLEEISGINLELIQLKKASPDS